jgi:hypothetical protein
MKSGDPIHVGGGYLVRLCHPVAYIPSLAGVMWHTWEEGYVFLCNDVNGHLRATVIPNDIAFMQEHSHEYKLFRENVLPADLMGNKT